MSPKKQIVVISSIDWDAPWQRHQIFASLFAKAGREVFFVENSGFRNPGSADSIDGNSIAPRRKEKWKKRKVFVGFCQG